MFCIAYSFTLRMETVPSSELFVNCYRSVRYHTSEDGNVHPFYYFSGTVLEVRCRQVPQYFLQHGVSGEWLVMWYKWTGLTDTLLHWHMDRGSLETGTACTIVGTGLVTTVACVKYRLMTCRTQECRQNSISTSQIRGEEIRSLLRQHNCICILM